MTLHEAQSAISRLVEAGVKMIVITAAPGTMRVTLTWLRRGDHWTVTATPTDFEWQYEHMTRDAAPDA